MRSQPFVIITTRLPPAACGIGTFSACLRRSWPNESSEVEFLVVEDNPAGSARANADRVTPFHGDARRLASELARIGAADVLLHYAGRAYQRFGSPVWMPGVLAAWRKQNPGSRLMIFAHEMPGEMPVISRHFWLGKLNAWILRRLASIADVLVTNTHGHAAQWRKLSGRDDIQVVPVGSNIEPFAQGNEPRSRGEFVIFGLSFGRLQTLQLFASSIGEWIAEGRITKLHLIGPGGDEFARQSDELIRRTGHDEVFVRHGLLPAAEVARFLARAEFALANVTGETWSKSGTFMACAASGCPIVISEARPATVPLSYAIDPHELRTISEAERAGRSAALARWYRENADWTVIAPRLANLLGGTTAVSSERTADE